MVSQKTDRDNRVKIIRNGGPPQQRGFTDIVKRISKENVDQAVSNVRRGCRRCQLVVLHGQVETGTESDVTLRCMHATRNNGDLWCLKLGEASMECTTRSVSIGYSQRVLDNARSGPGKSDSDRGGVGVGACSFVPCTPVTAVGPTAR